MNADDLIASVADDTIKRLRFQLDAERRRSKRLEELTRRQAETFAGDTKPPKIRPRKAKAAKHTVRVIIPDSHGEHIDPAARDAFLNDLPLLSPDEVVFLGDHLDCGGTLSGHQKSHTNELTESYSADVAACNHFLDAIDERTPNARKHYLYGNHEFRVERWATRAFDNAADARLAADAIGPAAVLRLKQRGYEWYTQSETYHDLSVPGTIRLGKVHFTHGMSHAKHADSVHLARVGANVVFGHVHRVMHVGERTVTNAAFGAWCPGTLAKLQPLYQHTRPTSWQHGYGVQFCNQSTGTFVHFNVPIIDGVSLMQDAVDAIDARKTK